MGFMSEEVIVVGSSVFNLAGDADQRGVYLKNYPQLYLIWF